MLFFVSDEESKDALKSAISLVHEIALKRNFSVNFEVHDSLVTFICTLCSCMHLRIFYGLCKQNSDTNSSVTGTFI